MGSLQEYADLFKKLDLSELSVEEEGLKLTLKREQVRNSMKAQAAQETDMTSETIACTGKQADTPSSKPEEVSGTEIKAPLLGVFYANEVPVKQGDEVKKGDVLCSIEAMKMMNEVRSSSDGKIIEVLAENGSLVEYHQTLFVIG